LSSVGKMRSVGGKPRGPPVPASHRRDTCSGARLNSPDAQARRHRRPALPEDRVGAGLALRPFAYPWLAKYHELKPRSRFAGKSHVSGDQNARRPPALFSEMLDVFEERFSDGLMFRQGALFFLAEMNVRKMYKTVCHQFLSMRLVAFSIALNNTDASPSRIMKTCTPSHSAALSARRPFLQWGARSRFCRERR
jgi:hypothetical protein